MNSKNLTIGTALAFIFAGAVGAAETKTTKFHCTFSATFADGVETNIDTNDDGASAVLDQGISNCNPTGRFFFQDEMEWIHSEHDPRLVPKGRTSSMSVNPPDNSVRWHKRENRGSSLF